MEHERKTLSKELKEIERQVITLDDADFLLLLEFMTECPQIDNIAFQIDFNDEILN